MNTVIIWKLSQDGEVAIYKDLNEAQTDEAVETAVALMEIAGIKNPYMYIAVVQD